MQQVRYLNKDVNYNERLLQSNWWREQINHYGQSITYYTHGYTLTSHDFLYGEDPTSKFLSAGPVIMLSDITNDSLMLSKFGIMADCDMTAVVHISAFYEIFGPGNEPKAGDLIELSEYGGYGDRPGGRGAPVYEITERDDEALNQNANHLLGHYTWILKCKRWEYSYEPGTKMEPLNTQFNDSGTGYGILSGGATPPNLTQSYPDNADSEGKKIYDYDCNKNDSVYGGY